MRRSMLLGVLICALVLLGLATVRGSMLALAIPLLLYAGAALLDAPETPRLQVKRTLSADRVSRGTPVEVTLAVTNLGARPITVELEDLVPARLERTSGQARLLARIAPGAETQWSYTLAAERGVYSFGDLHARVSDSFGLFHQQAALPAPGQLFVVPEIARLRRAEIRPRRTQVFAGQIPARIGGAGVEFFGVREYQPGDPTRFLNARASARNPQSLFVNEFEQERVADVGLILDCRARSDVRFGPAVLFDHAIAATAALADVFLQRGNRVGLLLYGRALDWTLPGYGKVQRERILRALARAETGDMPAFERLDVLPTRLFPARSQLVLVSPLQAHDLEMLARLRARRYQLLVISPDPVAFERQALGASALVAQAAQIAHLERALLLRRCRQVGVPVVDWPVDLPFQQVAEAALSRPLWSPDTGGA